MHRRIAEGERIAQEKILKAEKIKADRIEKIRSSLNEKEQNVQKHLMAFKEEQKEQNEEKRAKTLERSKLASAKFNDMKLSESKI